MASLLPLHNFYSVPIRLLEPEPSSSEAGEIWVRDMAAEFCLRSICFMLVRFFLHAVNLRHGTDGFTSPPKEVVLRIFITLKNSSGLNPRSLGPVASTLPLDHRGRLTHRPDDGGSKDL
jgi:hypothetical protein